MRESLDRRSCDSLIMKRAKVAELADAPDLGSGGATHEGSTPSFRTTPSRSHQPTLVMDVTAAGESNGIRMIRTSG
jgi:hypothetical protein